MKKVVGIVLILSSLVSANEVEGQTTNTPTIATIAEQMPEYPGGIDSLMKEIAIKVVYPQQCSDSNIQGKVFIRFIVNENGSTTNAEVVKSPHPLLSAAALAAVKTIGKFKPATDKGKAVKVWYSLPVSFKIKQAVVQTPAAVTQQESEEPAVTEVPKIYTFTEIPPEFPSGWDKIMPFLNKNIHYPTSASSRGIEGKVLLRFVITEDGSISNIKVINGVDPALDAEAIRVVGLLPKFKPGMEKGKPVNSYFNLPVVFALN